jgi:hypothetical protein
MAVLGLVGAADRIKHACRPIPHVEPPYVDAAAVELGAHRLAIDNDEVQTLNRARHGRRDPVADEDRAL